MQLDDIRDEVRAVAGTSSLDGDAADAEVTRIINRALWFISRDFDWPWLETVDSTNVATAASTGTYTPPADWRKTKLITVDDDVDLTRVNDREISFYSRGSLGLPRFFAVLGGDLVLMPTPDDSYALQHIYYATEAVLSGDTDEPAMPDFAIDYLIVRSAKLLAVRMRDQESYSRLRMEEDELRDKLPGQVRQIAQAPRIIHRRDTFPR